MEFFRTKEWTVMDIGLPKWAALFYGMILGAFVLVSYDTISGILFFL